MSWSRWYFVALIALGVVGSSAGFVLAEPVEAELEKASDELHEAAHAPSGVTNASADPLSFDPDLAIWTVVVFVILLVVLKKFAWKPMLDALDKREHKIHDQIAAAERSHDEAKAMLAEYERKIASAAEEVKAMLEEARRDAEQTKVQIMAEAKAGSDAERARALRDVEAATDAALKQIGEQAANLAVDLAGRIVGAKLSPADHSKLISDAMVKFRTGSPSQN